MDPITQGALGAVLPQSLSKKAHMGWATLLGWFSGMAPDIDVFIRSNTDPLLALEYHRQFTHSLFFVPLGGLVCALFFYALLRSRLSFGFRRCLLYCTLGYATHALLDACTSYGTLLFWPFSQQRFSWDTVSVVDPLVTIPLILLVIFAAKTRKRTFAVLGLSWVIGYQLIGFYQNQRVQAVGHELAELRGHKPLRLAAKPTLGNILLWKVIYETEQGFQTDGVRASTSLKVYRGEFVAKPNIKRDYPWLDLQSQQALDLKRFSWFSQGYLAIDKNNPLRVFDARYSLLPNEARGLWSIRLSPIAKPDQHVEYVTDRDVNTKKREQFFSMLKDEYEGGIEY